MSEDLFGTTWVHVAEEDTGSGEVFRPEDADIPLSRRPRQWLELDADGTARLFVAGPDDRLKEQSASWSEEDGTIVIRTASGERELRVEEHSAERLVVRVRPLKDRR